MHSCWIFKIYALRRKTPTACSFTTLGKFSATRKKSKENYIIGYKVYLGKCIFRQIGLISRVWNYLGGSSSVGIHSHLVKTHSWRKSQLEITVGKFYQLPIFTNWLSQFSNWSRIQNPGYFSNCADFPSENFYQVRFFAKCEFFPSVPIDFQSRISFQVRIFSKWGFFPSVISFQV